MNENQVSKLEFKAKALEFFRQIETSRESLIVTDYGKPVSEVRPFRDFDRNPLELPGEFHKDPADRIIVATARKLAVSLVTKDDKIRAYAHVKTIW